MDYKRVIIVLVLAGVAIAGYTIARDAAEIYLWLAGFAGSYRYDILFETHAWGIPVSITAGLVFGALTSRYRDAEPDSRAGLIRRHAAFGTFLEHWAVALGGVVLMATGILLGFLFVPRFADSLGIVGLAFNLHYGGVLLVLFGISYHLTNHWLAAEYEIVPSVTDLGDSFRDIGYYLGLTEKPRAGKYLPIQKVSYVIWGVLLGVLAITGLVKSAGYVLAVSPAIAGFMTLVHDIFALLAIVFLVVHVSVILMPSHLQLLRAQLTGWIPESYVREHHPDWYERLRGPE